MIWGSLSAVVFFSGEHLPATQVNGVYLMVTVIPPCALAAQQLLARKTHEFIKTFVAAARMGISQAFPVKSFEQSHLPPATHRPDTCTDPVSSTKA
jgi:hypothetical protein